MISKLTFSKMCKKKVLIKWTHVFFHVFITKHTFQIFKFLEKKPLREAKSKWYRIQKL